MPKLVLVGVLWLIAVILASARIVQEFRDPMYNLTVDVHQLTVSAACPSLCD